MSGESSIQTRSGSWSSTDVETSVDFHVSTELHSSSGADSTSDSNTSEDGTSEDGTSEDGTAYGSDAAPVAAPGGTPSMTSYDTDRNGYYESTASDADGDAYADLVLPGL